MAACRGRFAHVVWNCSTPSLQQKQMIRVVARRKRGDCIAARIAFPLLPPIFVAVHEKSRAVRGLNRGLPYSIWGRKKSEVPGILPPPDVTTRGEEGACLASTVSSHGQGAMPHAKREEAVQGAGMLGPFQAQGAAESDASDAMRVRPRSGVWLAAGMALHFGASDCPSVRSHVPGMRRDRAQADEAGIRKAKPLNRDSFRRNPPMGRLQKGFGP